MKQNIGRVTKNTSNMLNAMNAMLHELPPHDRLTSGLHSRGMEETTENLGKAPVGISV